MAANLSHMQKRVLPITLMVVVLLIALRWYGPTAQEAPEELARNRIGPYRPDTELLQAQGLSDIATAYETGDSTRATELVITALEQDSALSPIARAELTLALANFNLRQGHPDLARTRLLEYETFPQARQRAEANWWLAISYLTEENLPAARRHLHRITRDASQHRQQAATDLLQRMPEGK